MKASELIEELQVFIEDYGDLPVVDADDQEIAGVDRGLTQPNNREVFILD